MEDFKNLAAKKGYYTLDNLPNEILTNTWFSERFEGYVKNWNDYKIPTSLNKFDYVCKFFEIANDGERCYMDGMVLLAFDGKNIRSLRGYKGMYRMYPLHQDTCQYQMYLNTRDLPQLDRPNLIGVFTEKKLKEWFNWCDTYVTELVKSATNRKSKEAECRDIIAKFIADIKNIDPAMKLREWQDSVFIETHNFDVTLKLTDNNTHLESKINYRGGLEDLLKLLKK